MNYCMNESYSFMNDSLGLLGHFSPLLVMNELVKDHPVKEASYIANHANM